MTNKYPIQLKRYFEMDGNHIVSRGEEDGIVRAGQEVIALRDLAIELQTLLGAGSWNMVFMQSEEGMLAFKRTEDEHHLAGVVGQGGDGPLSFLYLIDQHRTQDKGVGK